MRGITRINTSGQEEKWRVWRRRENENKKQERKKHQNYIKD
jgi:hypothetical protein